MSSSKKCNCSWPECAWMTEQINLYAHDKHEWRGEYITWRQRDLSSKNMCQKMLFLAAACKHVKGVTEFFTPSGDEGYKKEITLAPHHFPVAVHQHKTTHRMKKSSLVTVKQNMTNFVKDIEMDVICKKDISFRLKEDCNLVDAMSAFLKKLLPPGKLLDNYAVEEKLLEGKDKLFVCAPVATRKEVLDYVNSLSRKRTVRLPLVSPTPKKMRLLPGAAVPISKMASLLQAINEVESSPNLPVIDSPDKVLSVQQCTEILQSKVSSLGIETACLQTNFRSCIRLLRVYHCCFEGIPISTGEGTETRYLYPCKNDIKNHDKCDTFRMSEYFSGDGRYCVSCKNEVDQQSRKTRKINQPELSKLKGRRLGYLPMDNLRQLASDGRRLNKNLKQRNNYLIKKLLEKQKNEPKLPGIIEGDACDFIKEVFKFVHMNKHEFTESITTALLELNAEKKSVNIAKNTREVHQFAKFLVGEISNKSKQLGDKNKQVRYSSTTINLAMNVYLKSKNSYEDLRKRSLTALPCTRHLQQMKAAFRSMEGDNPACYAPLLDSGHLKYCAGHLCVDEVKIKADLIWNVKNNELTGFCSVGTSPKVLKEQLRRIIEDDEELEYHAVYANQWRFRSVFSDHHTSEFYFNNGSLDCDQLNCQLLGVVLNYESIGVKVHGVVSDAGGSNEGLFGMFREGIPILDNEFVLRPEQVTMRNPYCPERLIWFWHCSIHNLKNIRNLIWRSFIEGAGMPNSGVTKVKDMSKRKNCLMRFDDKVHFGWQGIMDCFNRESERVRDRKGGNNCLSFQAVHLDSLTLMNVPYAKAVFSRDVLAEITNHIRSQLLDLLEKSHLDPERGERKGYDAMNEGAVGKRFLYYASVFRKAIPKEGTNRYYEVKSDILLLEYLAVIHSIFTERFINPGWYINRDNIDEELVKVQEMISLLGDWQQEKVKWQAEATSKDNKSWRKHLMAWKTYRNLRIGVSGFFGYARDILETYEDVSYIPAHHSNQSMIEAYFSLLRAHNHDVISKVGCGVASSNAMSVIKGGGYIADVVKGRKLRDVTFDDWKAKLVGGNYADVPILQPGETIPEMKHPLSKSVLELLTTGTATKGFANFLTESTRFADYARLSLKTQQAKFFSLFVEGNHLDYVNARCQSIVEWCIQTFDDCLEAPSNSRRRLFFFHLYQKLCEQNASPAQAKETIHNNLGWSVVHLILSKFVLSQVKKVFQNMKPAILEESVDIFEMQKTDINTFFGWSLFSVKKVRLRGVHREDWDDNDNDDETSVISRLLQDWCTKESEIIDNEEYVKNYYPFVERITNEGGLTLVDPKYIELGHAIMLSITRQVSVEKLKMEGNNYTRECRKAIVADIESKLLPMYLQLSKSVSDDIKVRTKLFHILVDKTFHCRTGAFLKYYYSENKARGTKGQQDSGIREKLKHIGGANVTTENNNRE